MGAWHVGRSVVGVAGGSARATRGLRWVGGMAGGRRKADTRRACGAVGSWRGWRQCTGDTRHLGQKKTFSIIDPRRLGMPKKGVLACAQPKGARRGPYTMVDGL